MKKILTKLNSRAGESLGETLTAVLISVLSLTMLAGSVVASGRVNAAFEKNDRQTVYFDMADEEVGQPAGTLTVTDITGAPAAAEERLSGGFSASTGDSFKLFTDGTYYTYTYRVD